MTEMLRSWIIGITCAAMISAVLQAFMPKGGTGRAGRLAGGLMLLLAVVQPLAGLDYDSLAQSLTQLRLAETGQAEAFAEMNEALMKELIETETEAYILDKTEELGITCRVDVTYHLESGETPYPQQVVLTGQMTEGQRERLAKLIEADLGVPVQNQVYEMEVE